MPTWYGVPRLAEIVPERWVAVASGLSARLRRRLLTDSGVLYTPELRDLTNMLQVNVRLGNTEFGELQAAAHIAGTTPTTLARMLILGGTRKVLAEHGRSCSALAED